MYSVSKSGSQTCTGGCTGHVPVVTEGLELWFVELHDSLIGAVARLLFKIWLRLILHYCGCMAILESAPMVHAPLYSCKSTCCRKRLGQGWGFLQARWHGYCLHRHMRPTLT